MFKGLFANTRLKGQHYEKLAEQYLQAHGLTAIEQNYYCQYGEIDLIMQEQSTWVFVEVKYRRGSRFGGALSALSTKKLRKLKRSIFHYLASKKLQNAPIRIDYIAIEGDSSDNIKWIKNIS